MLILIPVIIAALQVLNIEAVSAPAIQMLDTIFKFIPNILAALVIIIIGCMVAKFSGNGNKLNLSYDEIDDIIRQGKEPPDRYL